MHRTNKLRGSLKVPVDPIINLLKLTIELTVWRATLAQTGAVSFPHIQNAFVYSILFFYFDIILN